MAEEGRPAIPRPLGRQVLVEAGHRCAIPTCRQAPVELHHIVPWAQVREHRFDNLIALCPTDHARATKGEIDRQSILAYKRNLAVLTSRYGEMERRLLDMFAANRRPGEAVGLQIERSMDFELMYLLKDGLLEAHHDQSGMYVNNMQVAGVHRYALTRKGEAFLDRWVEGRSVEEN